MAFSFQVSPSHILIAGGYNGGTKKDSYLLDIVCNTLSMNQDLPVGDYFKSQSAIVIDDALYAVGVFTKSVVKYCISEQEWETVHKFKWDWKFIISIKNKIWYE